jgi:anaphase-promoting complex subunit 4
MGWVTNLTSRKRNNVGSKNGAGSWGNLLEGEAIFSENPASLNLPRDLTLIDIETSLPKLSVLASGGSP